MAGLAVFPAQGLLEIILMLQPAEMTVRKKNK